jgi:hypothetical protein
MIVFNFVPMFQVFPPPNRIADRKIHGFFAFPSPGRLLAAILADLTAYLEADRALCSLYADREAWARKTGDMAQSPVAGKPVTKEMLVDLGRRERSHAPLRAMSGRREASQTLQDLYRSPFTS